MRIQVLNKETANKIAAGEVVENPAAVIKELIENSLDAGSSNIKIYVKKTGIEKIRVIDDGCGINPDDIELAFSRHATNKITTDSDLVKIKTLGFRGEALASIASVSKTEVKTRQENQDEGIRAVLEGGVIKKKEACGCPRGTDIEVRELFYNTPARFKFLKKKQNELGKITDTVNKLSLANPEVSFTLVHDDRQLIRTSGKGELLEVIASIYGFQTVKQMLEIEKEKQTPSGENIAIKGYISKPELTRASRNYQAFIVNGRYIKSKMLSDALEEGYKGTLPRGRFPLAVVNLDLPYEQVDVNVHPAKLHLRFDKDKEVIDALKESIWEGLMKNDLVPHIKAKNNHNHHQSVKETGEKNKEKVKEVGLQDIFKDISTDKTYETPGTYEAKKSQDYLYEKSKYEESKYAESNEWADSMSGVGQDVWHGEKQDVKQDVRQDIDPETADLMETTWKNFKIIGQVFLTYWIIEKEDTLFFVDQHAVHERINYHKLLNTYRQSNVLSQNIIPFTLEVESSELLLIESNLDNIKKLGLEFDIFGNNTIIVRAVPYVVKDICDGNFVRDFITTMASILKEETRRVSLELWRLEEILISIACKKSIKANEKLSREEFESLIFELKEVSNPYTCPHGRPTLIKFTQQDLEKYFKRIM